MHFTKIAQSLSTCHCEKIASCAHSSCAPEEHKDLVPDVEHVLVTNNHLFQYLFDADQNKELTIDLLNSFVEEELKQKIVNIVPCDQELPPTVPEFKGLHCELTCYLENGSFRKTAMQLCKNGLADFAPIFWSWIFNHQIKDESEIDLLKPCISFNILDYQSSDLSSKLHIKAVLGNIDTHEIFSDDMSIHYVQIPLVNISEHMLKKEKWAAFLSEKFTLSQKEKIAKDEPLILKAIAQVRKYMSVEENVNAYLASEKKAQEEKQEYEQEQQKKLQKEQQKEQENGTRRRIRINIFK